MTYWVCRLSRSHGQYRLTIPKAAIEAAGWKKEKYLRLDERKQGKIMIRGLDLNAKKTTNGKTVIDGPG